MMKRIKNKNNKIQETKLNASSYVIQNGVITFTKPCAFEINHFDTILKKAKKLKKGQIMCNLMLMIPFPTMLKKKKTKHECTGIPCNSIKEIKEKLKQKIKKKKT